MGVKTKSKRKIEVNGRKFLWYVELEEEYLNATILHVYSADKRFHVTYAFNQIEPGDLNVYFADKRLYRKSMSIKPKNKCLLRVLGPDFNGLPADAIPLYSVVCPQWEHDSIIAPADVRRLIEWSLSDKSDITLMDWQGNERIISSRDKTTLK